MRAGFDRDGTPRRRPPWLFAGLVLLGVLLVLGGYTGYRTLTFAGSVFGGSQPPALLGDQPAMDQADDESAAAESALMPVTPAPAGRVVATPESVTPVPLALATRAATATPAPDETTIVGKLRAGRRVTFLLIGYGGLSHDAAYLTDALVVASFEPKSGRLALFNLPRDLWVQTPLPGGRLGAYRRINELYTLGLGPAGQSGTAAAPADHDRAAWLVATAAQQVLGLPIDGWVSSDFDAVRRVVDGLGGVMVDVDVAFDDYLYPRHDSAAVDPSVKYIHFDAGRQRLTGERALQYVRSRQSLQDGTDFGRSRRQQRLLLALKDQALTPLVLPKVFSLMDAVQGHLRTSLGFSEARDLLFYGRDRNGSVTAAPAIIDTRELLVGTVTDGGASVLMPKAGAGNYGAIHRFVRTSLRPLEERTS